MDMESVTLDEMSQSERDRRNYPTHLQDIKECKGIICTDNRNEEQDFF